MGSESEFLQWIAGRSAGASFVKIGVGDDLAALKWDGDDLLLVGVDQVMEGVHFDSKIHSPRQIGRKVVNRNFSDCAAMGCLPAAMVATVALPRDYSMEKAKEFYFGLREAADVFSCALVGGDTGVWDGKLVATVTVLGKSAGVKPVTRSGAKVGDKIFVTGALGGSILGRHMGFLPRVEMGRKIAPIASAMIDISDGLLRDLGNVCRASGVGAIVESGRVPIHADAVELSGRDGVSGLEHALGDGEDYELLYCSGAGESSGGICVGRIVEERGIFLEDEKGRVEKARVLGWDYGIGDD
jgi:thiamine-monophosphate kinase